MKFDRVKMLVIGLAAHDHQSAYCTMSSIRG